MKAILFTVEFYEGGKAKVLVDITDKMLEMTELSVDEIPKALDLYIKDDSETNSNLYDEGCNIVLEIGLHDINPEDWGILSYSIIEYN